MLLHSFWIYNKSLGFKTKFVEKIKKLDVDGYLKIFIYNYETFYIFLLTSLFVISKKSEELIQYLNNKLNVFIQ